MQGAGGGRPPKPEGQARNRNKPTRSSVEIPTPAANPVSGIPPKPIVALDRVGKIIWAEIWASPSASQWRSGDVPALSRMAWLQQNPVHWLDPRLLSEIRQLEDRFGLNAYARRQMKWDEAPAELPKPAAKKTRNPVNRREAALRLVTGEETG